MTRRLIAVALGLLGAVSQAQECTQLWHKNLNINPDLPRPNSGDTFAGYGLLGFKNDYHTKFQFKGEFAHARFTSIESYITMKKLDYDAIFDFQINPDPGSFNPFREGVALDVTNRSYTVDAIPAEGHSTTPNVVNISPTDDIYSFYFRIYSPNRGVVLTDNDVPRVWAFDSVTGAPKECPEYVYTSYEPHYPQALAGIVAAATKFEFKTKVVKNGQNHAIPFYSYAVERVRHGAVTVIRMKAPTFFNSQSDSGPFQKSGNVRYWSFCTQNFVINQTLNCVPDYLAKIDADGFTTTVIGKGAKVKAAAEKRGYNFLEDLREKNQHVEGFAYRNIFPGEAFKDQMYQGDYQPQGTVCSEREFLAGDCP